jgi:hypothetical protein
VKPFDSRRAMKHTAALNLNPPVPTPSVRSAAQPVSRVRQSFSEARRKALQTQGKVTYQMVQANQLTMKSVP